MWNFSYHNTQPPGIDVTLLHNPISTEWGTEMQMKPSADFTQQEKMQIKQSISRCALGLLTRCKSDVINHQLKYSRVISARLSVT